MRRRSLSSDRFTISNSKTHENKTIKLNRDLDRRKTMPINLNKKLKNKEEPISNSGQDDSSSGEMPKAPSPQKPSEFESIKNSLETPEAILTTEILKGILETDF